MKTPFTEEEINELCDLNKQMGEMFAGYEIIKILQKEHNLSDVNSIIITLRKHINKRNVELNDKRKKNYPNSTLDKKLSIRIEEDGYIN